MPCRGLFYDMRGGGKSPNEPSQNVLLNLSILSYLIVASGDWTMVDGVRGAKHVDILVSVLM